MKTKDAADLVGVTPKTLRKWAREGRVPCAVVRRGDRTVYQFNREALERWLAGEAAP